MNRHRFKCLVSLLLGGFIFLPAPATDDGAMAKVKDKDKELQSYPGFWENKSGMVERKFDTPGGTVYRFAVSSAYQKLYFARDQIRAGELSFHTSRSCQCDVCRIRRQYYPLESVVPPSKRYRMRFVAVDFAVRKFPAMQRDPKAKFELILGFSSFVSTGGDLARVDGIVTLPHPIFYNEACRDPLGDLFITNSQLPISEYSWNRFRIIFDTETKVITVLVNGGICFIQPLKWPKGQGFDINSINLSVDDVNRNIRPYLEISNPTFYRFGEFVDLLKLSKLDYQLYPYGLYGDTGHRMFRKWQSGKNCDAEYAAAMRILRGKSDEPLPKAIDLLQKASKDGHVFADYELGICYAYGVGVRRDPDKSRKYFRLAVNNGYEDDAQSTMFLLSWAQSPHEIFLEEDLLKLNQDCRDASQSSFPSDFLRRYGGPMLDHTKSGEPLPRARKKLLFPEEIPKITVEAYPPFWGDKNLSILRTNPFPVSTLGMPLGGPLDARYFWRLKLMMAADYPLAFYRYGDFWRQQIVFAPKRRTEYLGRALEAFRQGAERGDDLALVEALATEARLGLLSPASLTPETELRLHRNPRYYLLKYLAANPLQAWSRDFLAANYGAALNRLPPADEPEAKYLRGLLLLSPYFEAWTGTVRIRWRLMDGFFSRMKFPNLLPTQPAWDDAIDGYALIEEAAEAGLPEAKFLIGTLYLVTPDRTVAAVIWNVRKERGVKFLSSLDPTAWPLASYYLTQYASKQTNLNIKLAEWETRLKPACDANFGPAWYLLGQLCERYNNPVKAEAAYRKAGDAGMALGYSAAACIMDENRRDSRATWRRFLQAHLEERRRNRLDPFEEHPEFVVGKNLLPANRYYPGVELDRLLQ